MKLKLRVWVTTVNTSRLMNVNISVVRTGIACFSLRREYHLDFGQKIQVAPGNWICLVSGNGSAYRIETTDKVFRFKTVLSRYFDPPKRFFDHAATDPVRGNKSLSRPPPSNKKRAIPKGVKQQVWNKHIGEDIGMTKCPICNHNTITQMNFHAAHIHAEANGGEVTVSNLMPTCAQCNLSCGTMNLLDYKKMLSIDLDVSMSSGSNEPSVRSSPRRRPCSVTPTIQET